MGSTKFIASLAGIVLALVASSGSAGAAAIFYHHVSFPGFDMPEDGMFDEATEEYTSALISNGIYSFNVEIEVTTSSATLQLINTNRLNVRAGESHTFTASIVNFAITPGSGIHPGDISPVGTAFTFLEILQGENAADAGSIIVGGATGTWQDTNNVVAGETLNEGANIEIQLVPGFPAIGGIGAIAGSTPSVLPSFTSRRTGSNFRLQSVNVSALIMIPEPSRAVLLLLSGGLIFLRRRR